MSTDIAHYLDVLGVLGPVRARRMFGGHGLFLDGLMFALVLDDQLYLKADAHSQPEFLALGLAPFVYQRRGKPVSLSYWQAPDEVMDDPDAARHWGRLAFEAALRNRG